ncbi:MAG: hypothetical protein ABSG81_02845 [Acidimicrobiales bacterium]|jgi:hypothetical protein
MAAGTGCGAEAAMTLEPGRAGERGPADTDLIRSMALSSAELWHEILERLREVQESQVRLAGAIETLGTMVRDALSPESQPVIGAHSRGASLERPASAIAAGAPAVDPEPPTAVVAPLADVPPPPDTAMVASPDPAWTASPDPIAGAAPSLGSDPDPGQAPGFPPAPVPPRRPRHAAPTGPEPIDAFLGFKTLPPPAESFTTGVETSAPGATSGAGEVSEPLFATEVPEPLFYAPSGDEEILPAAAVADLASEALDQLLAAEFGVHLVATNAEAPPTLHLADQDAELAVALSAVTPVVAEPVPAPAVAPPTPVVEPPFAAPAPAVFAPPEIAMTASPAETLPIEAAPVEAAPIGVMPVETAPIDGMPIDGMPIEAAVAPPVPELEMDAPAPTARAHLKDPNVVLDILLGARPAPEDWQIDNATQVATMPQAVDSVPSPVPVFTDMTQPTTAAFIAEAPAATEATPVAGEVPPAPPLPPVFGHADEPPIGHGDRAPEFGHGDVPAAVGLGDVPPLAERDDTIAPPVFMAEAPPPPVFTTDGPPPPPAFTPETPAPPPPPPPIPTSAPPPAPPMPPMPAASATPPPFVIPDPPAPHLAEPPPPPPLVGEGQLQAAPIFVDAPITPFVHSPLEGATEMAEPGHFSSVASMATEILSATPEIPTMAAPEPPASELISKDLTLIARGRKKRFRLR